MNMIIVLTVNGFSMDMIVVKWCAIKFSLGDRSPTYGTSRAQIGFDENSF